MPSHSPPAPPPPPPPPPHHHHHHHHHHNRGSLGHRLRERFSRLRWGRERRSSISSGDVVQSVHELGIPLASRCGRDLSRAPTLHHLAAAQDITAEDSHDSQDAAHDIWSAAFQEAVASLSKELDLATITGKSIQQIFQQLADIDKDVTQDSILSRGIKHLRSIQVPLERLKLALDIASPFAGIDPTARLVFGLVTGVTAIAISFASAGLEFAKQIGQMLNQLSYLDECDTLGQRANTSSIHQALVNVYRKLLEFYMASFDILTRKGVKLALKITLENNRLGALVDDFLKQADLLHRVVQNATAEIIQDLKVMLYDQEISKWLGSDKVERQSEYHAALGELRSDHACRFLLEHPNFNRWYQSMACSQLLVFGDMGTGKSMAAAYIVDELLARRNFRVPRPVICYHYCRNDETGRITHILSVLVLSLLEQLPGLKKTFYNWYKQKQASGNIEPVQDARKLTAFLLNILESVDRPLFIVVDGLDECDRRSRISLLELSSQSSQLNPSMKFLLFSRPSEELRHHLDANTRIDLVSDLGRHHIIAAHTVKQQLTYLSPEVQDVVITHLSRSANGSAIWTKMVVKLLEDRQVRASLPMTRLMSNMPLPSRLADLYDTLFRQCTMDDAENERLARAALKILAASSRPISRVELAWATALATTPHNVNSVAALAEIVDQERVLELVGPFVTHETGNMSRGHVRLSHQSVKEYVIRGVASERHILHTRHDDDDDTGRPARAEKSSGDLEAYMLDICIRYLLLDEIDQVELFSERQLAIEVLPQEPDLFEDARGPTEYTTDCTWDEWESTMIRYDPIERGLGGLFVYASCYWVEHFRAVDSASTPDLRSVETLCAAGSTRLQNWTQQNCRPGCAVQARFALDSWLYDPLGITSLYGSEAMLRNMILHSHFDAKYFLSNSAVAAAEQIIRWGDLARLRVLVQGDRARLPLPSADFWWLVVLHWSTSSREERNWDVVFPIFDNMPSAMVEEDCANEVLCMAAHAGCLPLVERLLALAQRDPRFSTALFQLRSEQQVSRPGKSWHQSVGEAVLGNHVDMVELLLQQEGIKAHIDYVNAKGETVLYLAAVHCNPTIFRLLTPHLPAEKMRTDNQGDSALVRIILSCAALESRLMSAQIMLLE